jgi:hypothetical protein
MNPPMELFQFAIVFTLAANLLFLIRYTTLEPWWKSSIGLTIAIESLLLILALVPSTLSLFFSFNRLTSVAAAWLDVGTIFLIGCVLIWRTIAFQVTSKRERRRLLAKLEARRKRSE